MLMRPGRRAERRQLHAAGLHADLPAETIDLDSQRALDLLPIIGQLAMMVFLPFAGALSDRVGRKPMWWASLIGLFVLAIPMYLLMARVLAGDDRRSGCSGCSTSPQLATISATFPAMFPTQVRYAGRDRLQRVHVALRRHRAVRQRGADRRDRRPAVPAYYMMVASVIGLIALKFTIETAGCSLRGTEIPGTEESKAEIREMEAAGR